MASPSIRDVNDWYARSVSSSRAIAAFVVLLISVRQSPGSTSASRSMPASAIDISDTRSAGESDNRAAVKVCSMASRGVGLGSSRPDAGGGSADATKLRSNRCRPAAARKSAIASSSMVTIWLISACL